MSLFNQQRETVALPSVAGVVQLLARAREAGLKFPKLWLRLADGTDLRIHVATSQSRTPGFLMLTDGGGYGNNKFFGKISPNGVLELYREGEQRRAELVPLLVRLAEEPARVAAEFGHLTGHCCFCALKLSDSRSAGVGYGQTCAKRFGLPWGEKRALDCVTVTP